MLTKSFAFNIFRFVKLSYSFDCFKFPLSQREYLWSAVNMLANSSKISVIAKRDIFQLYLSEGDDKR